MELVLEISINAMEWMLEDMVNHDVVPPLSLTSEIEVWRSENQELGSWKLPEEEVASLCSAIREVKILSRRKRLYFEIPEYLESKIRMFESIKKEEESTFLYNADPNCKHVIVPQMSGGIKCSKCSGWFCY